MSNTKSKLEYWEHRNYELHRLVLSLLDGVRPVREAVRIAVKSPCSRFWISPEYARKRISARLRGKSYIPSGKFRDNRERMIDEIMRRCEGDYSLAKIEQIVYSPAPEFYLCANYAVNCFFITHKARRYGKGK